MESRALQTLDGVKKAISLPKFEKLTLRLDKDGSVHIFSGHKKGGSRLKLSNAMGGDKDVFPEWMNEKQILNMVKEAYKNGKRVKTQIQDTGKVVTVEGYANGRKVRIHVNLDENIIDSAYPVKEKLK
jgi:Bacterial EndoU nuclease